MDLVFVQAEMPSLLTLAITFFCAGLVFVVIQLVCRRRRGNQPSKHTVVNQSEKTRETSAYPGETSEIPSSSQHIRQRQTTTVTQEQKSDSGKEAHTETRQLTEMGDKMSTPEEDGGNVESVPGTDTTPSAGDVLIPAPPGGGTESEQSADRDDNDNGQIRSSSDDDTGAVIATPGDNGNAEGGGDKEMCPEASEESESQNIERSDEVVETLVGTTEGASSQDQPAPEQLLRRDTDSSRSTESRGNSTENTQSSPPKRHAGIFEYNSDDSGSSGHEEFYEEQPRIIAQENSELDTAPRPGSCVEQEDSRITPDVETRQDDGELKSPPTMTASKALLRDDRGPCMTSTPVKHGSEIKCAVVERAQILATDLQTNCSDIDNGLGVNHREEPPVSDKDAVSSTNVCPQEFAEIRKTTTAEESSSTEVEVSSTCKEDNESVTSLDTFIVHSNVDSMVESTDKSAPVTEEPKTTEPTDQAGQTISHLDMDTITSDLKKQTENNKAPVSTPTKSDSHDKMGQRYKEYARYLLERYEAEVKQRERSEDWCEFLTSELDAHINARILAEEKYTNLLQRHKTVGCEYNRLKQQHADLENQLLALSRDSLSGAKTEDVEEDVKSPDLSNASNTEPCSDILEKPSHTDSSEHKLFSGVDEAKSNWQDQFNVSSSTKSGSHSVLSFYDFSALSSSYDDDGNLLTEYDNCVKTSSKVESSGGQEKQEEELLSAKTVQDLENSRQESGGDAGKDAGQGSKSSAAEEEVKKPSSETDPIDEQKHEERPQGQAVHVPVAKSIQDKAAMWEEKLSGKAHNRDDSDHDSDHDVLSASGSSIRDAREKLEEKLLGKASDVSPSSSRCDFSDEMLDSVQKAKMAWEDRHSISDSPGSANGSRGHSSGSGFGGGDDNNNNNDYKITKAHMTSLSSEVLGNVQQTKQLWHDLAANSGSGHSSRKMSLEGEEDSQSTGISHIPDALTQASEVSVQQTRLQWEQKMLAANQPPAADTDQDNDKGLCLYVEDELENDASNEHLSRAVVADSIGNVSQTKMMWEQALRDENDDDDDDDDYDDDDYDDEQTMTHHSPEIPRHNRFSSLKKRWEGSED